MCCSECRLSAGNLQFVSMSLRQESLGDESCSDRVEGGAWLRLAPLRCPDGCCAATGIQSQAVAAATAPAAFHGWDPPGGAGGGEVCTLLTVATLGGVLACLLRHFRWPLLPQPPLQPSLSAVQLPPSAVAPLPQLLAPYSRKEADCETIERDRVLLSSTGFQDVDRNRHLGRNLRSQIVALHVRQRTPPGDRGWSCSMLPPLAARHCMRAASLCSRGVIRVPAKPKP